MTSGVNSTSLSLRVSRPSSEFARRAPENASAFENVGQLRRKSRFQTTLRRTRVYVAVHDQELAMRARFPCSAKPDAP
jgi:hypothetical protein